MSLNYEYDQNGVLKEVKQVSLTHKTTMLKVLTYNGANNRETNLINTQIIM